MNTVYQSKLGFYPCDKETYLKLKKINKLYWQALHDLYKWVRWDRKQVQNRHGEEPKLCKSFITDELWHRTSIRTTEDGRKYTFHKYLPKTCNDFGFLELYQKARMPSQSPVTNFTEPQLNAINQFAIELNI